MKLNSLHKFVILLALTGLVSCGSSVNRDGATISIAPSEVPSQATRTNLITASATSTLTPSPTAIEAKIPYPSTPVSQMNLDVLNSPLASDLVFSKDTSCIMPCWYGLRVGESSLKEIQSALRKTLGVSENYVFIMGKSDILPGDYVKAYWEDSHSANQGPAYLSIVANFNPSTDILTGVNVITTHPLLLEHASPQHVLKDLGNPSSIWILFSPTEVAEVASLQVDFLYLKQEQWTFMSWRNRVPVRLIGTYRVADWCLNGRSGQEQEDFILRIPPDFDPTTTNMGQYGFLPLQEVFGVTPEALYQKAVSENNTCLSHKF